MVYRNRRATINVKLLVVLILVTAALAVALLLARQSRRNILSQRALAAGNTAFENQDWPAAINNYRKYLARHPDELEVLRKYAEACLSIRPLDAAAVSGAILAYRRVTNLASLDNATYEKLAVLYSGTGSFPELAVMARKWLQHEPNDLKAPLWLAEALARSNQTAGARQTLETFMQGLAARPGKHVEYVGACIQMSRLAASEAPARPQATGGNDEALKPLTSLEWLDKAVAYAPDSVEALVSRAQLQRRMAELPSTSEPNKPPLLALARQDLEAADVKGADDRRIRLLLAAEWMAHREWGRAAAELQAADKLPEETLKEQYLDVGDWTVARFLSGRELAVRKGAVREAAALADEALTSLGPVEKTKRGQVLPLAVRTYVAAGRIADAKQCLEEYLGLMEAKAVPAESVSVIGVLKALVEAAQSNHYRVIDILEPLVGKYPNDPQMLRLLADAYGRTDQAARAVNALEQYRRLNPQDREAVRALAQQSARMGDSRKALDAAREAESSDQSDVDVKLFRIETAVNQAVRRGQGPDTSALAALSAELAEMRQQHSDRVDIRVLQAVIAASLGQPQQAERELRQAIEECTEPLEAELQLIRQYVGTGRADDALAVGEAASKRQKDRAEPWLALSDLHAAGQDYDAARRSLRQGLETVTDRGSKRHLSMQLAILELTHGDRGTGIRLLEELARDPQEIQARLLLLESREVRADPNQAERLIKEVRQAEGESGLSWRLYQASFWLSTREAASKQQDITNLLQYCSKANPAWPAPVLLLAEMYVRQGDFKQAEDVYRQGLFGNPSAPELADGLLSLLVSQGRFADAEDVLRETQNPRTVRDWRVRIAVGAGDFSRARAELNLRVSSEGRDAASRIELAQLLYRETKDAVQAMRYLDEAKAITPKSGPLAVARASILRAEGKPAEALRVLNDHVADCNDFEAYWRRAVYLAEGGDVARAEQDYRKLTTFQDKVAAGYELLANFYFRQGNLDQAVAAVEGGLRAYPDGSRLRRTLMQFLLSRDRPGDRERALGLLAELERELPQDAGLMVARAGQKIKEGTPQSLGQAREILENVVRRQPRAVSAHLTLIGVAMREGQYQAAGEYAVRALASNPNDPALLVARGRAELALRYASMAARLAQQVLQQDPNNLEAIDVFAQATVSSGDSALLAEARKLIDSAVRRDPANETLLILRSHVCVAQNMPKGAIPELEVYCRSKEGGGQIKALVTLADLYRATGDMAQADAVIKQAEQLDSSQQTVVHTRLLWLASQKRFDDLKQVSAKYIAAKDQDLTIILRAASTLMSSDPPELKKEGVRLYQHASSLWPSSAAAWLGLASSLYRVGDAEGAEKTYRAYLQKHPDDPRALNDLAWILQEHAQQYADALELVNRGLRFAPDNLYLLDTRGTILTNMPDRLAEARKDYEELARQLAPSDAPWRAKVLLQLGRVCAKLDDVPQAKQYLQDALAIDQKGDVFTPEERSEIKKALEQCGA